MSSTRAALLAAGCGPTFRRASQRGWAHRPSALRPGAAEALHGLLLGPAGPRLDPLEEVVATVRQRGRSGVVPVVAHRLLSLLAGEVAGIAGWLPDEASVVAYGPDGRISGHRDNERYAGFVATLTLVGTADVDVLGDRGGAVVLDRLRCGPGDLLVLRGDDPRPLHRVGRPAAGRRAVLVLRRNQRGAGTGWR